MTDYTTYTRSELMNEKHYLQTELNKLMITAEPKEAAAKTNFTSLKTKLQNDIKSILDQLKQTKPDVPAPGSGGDGGGNDQAMIKSMEDTATVQNLLEVVRTVQKLATGDSIERFVSELDQIYEVEVKPHVGNLQRLEGEFVRASKRLLTFQMFSQMEKSGTNTATWATLKKYLVTNHGSKITMFQHLTRLWNLELKSDEKLTDFGAKLEEQIHAASLHIMKTFSKEHTASGAAAVVMSADDVFKLIGAMLASVQVRKHHEDIFKSMIKKMDTHYTAASLLADAQDYVDRLGANNNVTKTGAEVVFHSRSTQNKSSDQKKSSGKKTNEDQASKALMEIQKQLETNSKAIQNLTLTNTSAQTGERSRPYKKRFDKFNDRKAINRQICFKFQNGNCTKDQKCPDGRRHVTNHHANAVISQSEFEKSKSQNEIQPKEFDSLFQHGPVMN